VQDILTDPEYSDVTVPAGAPFTHLVRGAKSLCLRFLLVSGGAIGEPVARFGLMVITTQEELRIAFGEDQNGTLIKYGKL